MPVGIKEWKWLRMLTNFIVGKDSGGSLKDLKYLKYLCGELHISRLENMVDVQDTQEFILSDKEDLQVLVLEWGSQFDSRDEQVEEKILDLLRPPKTIIQLTVTRYGGMKFPSWIVDPSWSKLSILRLEGCENCTSLPSLGLLVSLKNLTISRMKGLKRIGSEFYGKGYPFQSLEILHFEYLEKWECWDPVKENEHVECFHRLRELAIVRCPKLSGRLPNNLSLLEKLVIHNCAELVLSFSTLPVLCKLEIDECKSIVCSSPTGCESLNSLSLANISDFGNLLRQHFQKVECLTILSCEELINLWQKEIFLEKTPQRLHSFTSLRELSVTNCNALTSWPKGMKYKDECLEKLQIVDCNALTFIFIGQLPASLKRLEVRNCEKLQCVLDDKEDTFSSSSSSSSVMHKADVNIGTSLLEYLFIEECPSLTCLSSTGQLPTTLTQLGIKKCAKLTTLSSRGQLPMTLKHLEIEECSELTTISLRGQLPEMLENLTISWCPKLESIVESFNNNMVLREIWIMACEKLKSIPEDLCTLSSLHDIRISYCPSLVSFPESGFPETNLHVWIKACEKLKALPKVCTLTYLQQLSLWDCPSMLFPEEGLPANLASLAIQGHKLYKPLKEGGLGNLTSLKELYISGLPDILSFQVKELGITLPHTLTRLYIGHFPNLKDLSSLARISLKWLSIANCPNLKSLRSLPHSLLELYISKCPLVEKQGIEWLKTVDISRFMIDGKLICNPEEKSEN